MRVATRMNVKCIAVAALCFVLVVEAASVAEDGQRSTSSFIGRFVHQNQSWAAYKSGDKGRVFYLNTATSKSQWTDPRKVDRQPSVLLPFLLPFLFVLGVGAVYIGYVYFTSPHLLMGPGKKRGSRSRAVMKPDKKSVVSPRSVSPKRDAAGAAGKPAAQKGE
ncbi:hypothetical protein V8C86DRAFT_2632092 [Haematococcus lacustris]|nr:hypothetical protein QJQ45_021023 [Haematococcus lacustris]